MGNGRYCFFYSIIAHFNGLEHMWYIQYALHGGVRNVASGAWSNPDYNLKIEKQQRIERKKKKHNKTYFWNININVYRICCLFDFIDLWLFEDVLLFRPFAELLLGIDELTIIYNSLEHWTFHVYNVEWLACGS